MLRFLKIIISFFCLINGVATKSCGWITR